MDEKVVEFAVFPFRVGQKIIIRDGPRQGDWTVIGVDRRKVTLRCPVTGTEVRWDRFCYLVNEDGAPVNGGK